MRRLQRLIAASVLVALSTVIAGCSSNMSSFDPMDWLDWIDTKKKLPGERKPVFPDGVPGLEQGVPKSLYKGAQEGDQNAQGAVPANGQQSGAQPAQPAPPAQQSGAAFPAPLPGGTFTR